MTDQTTSNKSATAMIEADGLCKYYGEFAAVEDVSFSIRQGQIAAFLGPNGAGKSTTIRLLLSLIYPSGGSATIFGKDCIQHGPELRRHIGYLPSEVFYYERMKVIDLLKYSASFFDGDCTQRMHDLAELMELDMGRRSEAAAYAARLKAQREHKYPPEQWPQ